MDKSLLIAQQEQGGVVGYRMLESIRTYGRERLAEIGQETMLRRRHRDWHQQLAVRFQAEWIGPRQPQWRWRLDRTVPDLRAALESSLSDPEQAEAAAVMAANLFMYWGGQLPVSPGPVLAEPGPGRSRRSVTGAARGCGF